MLKIKQIIPGIVISLSFAMLSSVEAATITDDNLNDQGELMSVDDIEMCWTQLQGTQVDCPDTPEEVTETIIKNLYDATFRLNSFTNVFGDDPIEDPGFTPSECNDSDPDGSNGLCFWGNSNTAILVLNQINQAIEGMKPIPKSVTDGEGFLPFPYPFYLIPYRVNEEDHIISHQGRNQNSSEVPSWGATPDGGNLSKDSFTMYAQFNFTGSESLEPLETPEPPTPTSVPESSSWLGVIVTGLCLILTNKKRG